MQQPRRVNVRGIVYRNGQILAQVLKANTADPFWSTPGGGLDDNESLAAGLQREFIEEIGIAPVIGKLLFMQQFNDGKREQLEFFFNIENVDDFDTIDMSKTTHGEIEVESCEFIDPKTSKVLPAFLQTIDIEKYITTDQPVFIYTEL